MLVLNKPAGMAVHGGSRVSVGCIEALRSLRPRQAELDLVHRLDRDTSGCLLIAKRRSALRTLHRILREGGMHKRYVALVKGAWRHGSLSLSLALAKQPGAGGARVQVAESGRPAQSEFRVLQAYGRLATLMEVSIPTGRTHQIRVHAAHLGHPIGGDTRYGDPKFNARMRELGLKRMFLHAHTLAFSWPDSDEDFLFSAPLPEALRDVQDRLEQLSKD